MFTRLKKISVLFEKIKWIKFNEILFKGTPIQLCALTPCQNGGLCIQEATAYKLKNKILNIHL